MGSPDERLHFFGIRHHGPGSARSLRAALEELRPELILVEGPPDANDALGLIGHEELEPPLALTVYDQKDPKNYVFYPFAIFSPEWQSLLYARENGVPARFIDLPQTIRMADAKKESGGVDPDVSDADEPQLKILRRPPDPLELIAEAGGYGDGERFWDHVVESRSANIDVFAAVHEIMAEARQAIEEDLAKAGIAPELQEERREAHMRQEIRAALKQANQDGTSRIAVVCGAWHVSALANMPTIKHDRNLLKGLPKVKTDVAWVPWTYDRLTFESGYGAGVVSPEWYRLLFEIGEEDGRSEHGRGVVRWATRAARLLREEELDASPASVIETVRLAEALAALRDLHQPRLEDLDQAVQTVLCFGDPLPMRLVREKLIVGQRMGKVPEDAPTVPLVHDLQRLQKRLRLKPTGEVKELDLDLRKESARARSHLLHRLNLLEASWGEKERSGSSQSTFHELWTLRWRPEIYLELVDAARFGMTVEAAASGKVTETAKTCDDLEVLANLLDDALLAELPQAVESLVWAIERRAAITGDTVSLMRALPPLARQARYGNVRQSDSAMVEKAVVGLVARICVGLGPACASLDDDAARRFFDGIEETQGAIELLQRDEYRTPWRAALRHLGQQPDVHGLIAGRAWRLLHESGLLDEGEAAKRLSRELSLAVEPKIAADWLEGFLSGSGLLLLHDEPLWAAVDTWISGLQDSAFVETLPLIRRTFSTFSGSERQTMASKAARGPTTRRGGESVESTWNEERVGRVLPILRTLLAPNRETEKESSHV